MLAVAALAMAFAIETRAPRGVVMVGTGWKVGRLDAAAVKGDRLDVFTSAPIYPSNSGLRSSAEARIPGHFDVRLTSLEPGVAPDDTAAAPGARSQATPPAASFEQRFFFAPPVASAAAPVAATATATDRAADDAMQGEARADDATQAQRRQDPRPLPAQRDTAPGVRRRPARRLSRVRQRPRATAPEQRLASLQTPRATASTPDVDRHTAIYDIAAHTVYLPDGEKLEAHSGLGSDRDDPDAVDVHRRGPTPPNTYQLSLREGIFHGVRAIRLTPVDDSRMFGRGGILVHSYLHGPYGQSNGCVAVRDYPRFLNAFLNGEVSRLVVVRHLATTPGPGTVSRWFADAIDHLFKPFERPASRASAERRDRVLSYQ